MTRPPSIIEIKNASIFRGGHQVFDQLSLSIDQGCNTAILGPNGAGKSTLLKLLSRELHPVYKPDSYIKIYGRERFNVWQLRKRLGIVSHELQLRYESDATGEQVIVSGFFASIGTWKNHHIEPSQWAAARRTMEDLDILHLRNRPYAAMSTGEQRRFLLGRALINDPQALILDEPTGGLDLKACFQYLHQIRHLMQVGKTVILVTHHIHEIPPEIERVVLLKNGTIVADGPKSDMMTNRNLSDLFETPIHLTTSYGYYQAIPAS